MLNTPNFLAMLRLRLFATLPFLLFSCWVVAAPQGAVSPSLDHDFGIVKQGQRLTYTFAIPNMGASSLRIDRIDFSEPGITARFGPDIPPGRQGQVKLEWDTTKANGETEATAVVRFNDPDQPEIPIELKAVVKPPIEFIPYPAVFFTAYQDEAPEKRVKIINNDETPLRIERIEFPEDHYQAVLDTVEPGKIYELLVRVRPGVPLGRYTEPIYLHTDRLQKPRFQMAANLFVKPDFYAFPEVIDLGSLNLEQLQRQSQLVGFLTQTTILTNRSGPLEIQSVTTDVPFLRVSRSPESGEDRQFRLDVEPILERMQPGKIQGQIRVLTNDPEHRELAIPVQGEVKF